MSDTSAADTALPNHSCALSWMMMKSNFEADADAGPVALEIAVGEAVAVGDGALVLHARVRHLDQLVAVLLERVFAEVVLEGLEHRLRLRELPLRLLEVPGQHVEIERQVAEPVGEVLVVADVQRHVVVVDRVVDQPVPARVAVAEVGLADELAVRDVDQAVGDRDADLHASRPRRATDPCSATRRWRRRPSHAVLIQSWPAGSLLERHPAEAALLLRACRSSRNRSRTRGRPSASAGKSTKTVFDLALVLQRRRCRAESCRR